MTAESTHVNCFRNMKNVSISVFTFLVSLWTLLFKFEASLSVSPNLSFDLETEVSCCTGILTELWFSGAGVVLPSWFCFFKVKSATVRLKSRCNVQTLIRVYYGYLQQLSLISLVMYQKHYYLLPLTPKHIYFHPFARLIAYDHVRRW